MMCRVYASLNIRKRNSNFSKKQMFLLMKELLMMSFSLSGIATAIIA
jgi:hypothetical protein